MDSNLIPALSGVLGSLVGGSATVATAWITQKTLTRRELNVADMRKREKLYVEFIGECARLLIDAFTHTLDVSAARAALGFEPAIGFDEGLARTFAEGGPQ